MISHATNISLDIIRRRISYYIQKEVCEEEFGFVHGESNKLKTKNLKKLCGNRCWNVICYMHRHLLECFLPNLQVWIL